jgi:histidine triad (HIT) family protein
MSDDFYCEEVLSGHTPVQLVFETGNVLAYHHTRPYWPVHVVVIPKKHIGSLLDLTPEDDELVLEMMAVVRRVAEQIMAVCGECRVLTNLGHYQDSRHLHWHVSAGTPLR